ncbi:MULTISPECIES: hypothetical protein [unclassified Paraburkholderia]|uniref:hypothetical protein n=1 Tax=unclassified Paraburkholderia TaxID=2615204 RepID=UPI00160BAA42|nr:MULTISPECIES: hypothetical protein [unclassified Paraburkholderia]MBB5442952.1 hypothetical protein [Paraburkholderia sp. WSM4177]MBB5483443.1 hypothetical protein [Paraburkholderia sp. WSM4180]
MNGVLFLFAQTLRWVQAGGSFLYDATFASDPDVGGYPQGAVLLNAALSGFWINTVEHNVTDPDATDGNAQGWLSMNPDWNATSGPGQILNRPDLAKVATSGRYDDLSGLPVLAAVATSGSYIDLVNAPVPGNYSGVIASSTTTILNASANGALVVISGTSHTTILPTPIGRAGIRIDLLNGTSYTQTVSTPSGTHINSPGVAADSTSSFALQPSFTIVRMASDGSNWFADPPQSNADWNATAGIAQILHKPALAPVATSCNYADLTNRPASAIVNLQAGAAVMLDLTLIVNGAPEILFNLPVAGGATTTLTIANPPAAGVLAEFVLVVANSANSKIVWPASIRWPQGSAPSLTGVAGKLDTFVIYTQDGGATYCGFVAAQNQ